MKKLVFDSNGKRIVFDDFTDERDQDYCGVWAGMCKACAEKYSDIVSGKLDECGSGCCSVDGCGNEADFYIDFWYDDDIEIIEE